MNTFLVFIFSGKETEAENKIWLLEGLLTVYRGWGNSMKSIHSRLKLATGAADIGTLLERPCYCEFIDGFGNSRNKQSTGF